MLIMYIIIVLVILFILLSFLLYYVDTSLIMNYHRKNDCRTKFRIVKNFIYLLFELKPSTFAFLFAVFSIQIVLLLK